MAHARRHSLHEVSPTSPGGLERTLQAAHASAGKKNPMLNRFVAEERRTAEQTVQEQWVVMSPTLSAMSADSLPGDGRAVVRTRSAQRRRSLASFSTKDSGATVSSFPTEAAAIESQPGSQAGLLSPREDEARLRGEGKESDPAVARSRSMDSGSGGVLAEAAPMGAGRVCSPRRRLIDALRVDRQLSTTSIAAARSPGASDASERDEVETSAASTSPQQPVPSPPPGQAPRSRRVTIANVR